MLDSTNFFFSIKKKKAHSAWALHIFRYSGYFLSSYVLWSCGYFVVLTTEAKTVRMNGTEQGNIIDAINRQAFSQCNPGN